MILNEEYFKDLNIEDEDIALDDTPDVEEPQNSFASGLDFIDYCRERYTDHMIIDVNYDYFNIHKDVNSLQPVIRYLFDSYGIEHSDVFVIQDFGDIDRKIKYNGERMTDYQIFDYGYKFLATQDPKIERPEDDWLDHTCTIEMYFNKPKFTEQCALRFIYSLCKAIFMRTSPFCIEYITMEYLQDIHDYFTISIDSEYFIRDSNFDDFVYIIKEDIDEYVHFEEGSDMFKYLCR